MTIAIRIGANSTVYDDLKTAYEMAKPIQQKLSIVGTGEEVENELVALAADADATMFGKVSGLIGSIKATNDLNLSHTQVTNYKAALIKLGTKSIVLDSGTNAADIASKFNDLDAVYSKIKSITLSDANTTTPTIAVGKLAGAVNLAGLEALTGKKFNVSGDVTSIKANMDNLLKNISRIDKVVLNAVVGTVNSSNATTVTSTAGHGFSTGDAIRYDGTTDGTNLISGSTYYSRKITDTTFQVFDTYAHAVDSTYTTNQDVSNATDTFTSQMAVQFTAKQLSILGDKLVKSDSAKVLLKDTADNLLATASLKLINKLNNTNINTAAITATISARSGTAVTSNDGHSFNTGDEITYNGTTGGGLVAGAKYYARKLTNTTFAVYNNYANSIAAAIITTGRIDTSAATLTKTFTSNSGPSPFRTTTLDDIQVTRATVNQANRFTTLTALNTAMNGPGAGNRLIADIVSSVEIMDTAANLTAGSTTKDASNVAFVALSAGKVSFAAGHGFKTGDAVTYSIATTVGATKIAELTVGDTYYLGQVGGDASDDFALFATKSDAMTAGKNAAVDLADFAVANTIAGAIVFSTNGVGAQKFTSSNLTKTMSDVSRYQGGTGNVGRVTLAGSGPVTTVTLNDFARKVNAGSDNLAKSTYSAKGVEIQNNLQALYDNQTAEASTGIKEIVVSDGTQQGKKAFTISEAWLNTTNAAGINLNKIFKEGVDQYSGNVRNKNYTFNVTNASFANTSTLQGDANVGAFAVTGATVSNLLNPATRLAQELSNSKLKTMTSVLMSASERAQVNELLFAIGSGPDRAKLKLNSTRT